jgi:transcriptional regulator of acetoin/glycerol metabolism
MSYTFSLLAKRIRTILDEKKITLTEISEENDIKQPALSQFLKLGTGLSMDKIELVCNYLGIESIDIPSIRPQKIEINKSEPKTMKEVMYLHLVNTLTENKWNISNTAEALGMTRWKLYKVLEENGIKKPKIKK